MEATIGANAGPNAAAIASEADQLALQGAVASLDAITAKLEKARGKLPTKQERTRVESRLRQVARTLERVGAGDPDATRALQACLQELDGFGGGLDLSALKTKLMSFLGLGSKKPDGAPAPRRASGAGAVRAPKTDAERATLLRGHIEGAVADYNRGDYGAVRKRLTDSAFAHSLGLSLKASSLFFSCDPSDLTPEDIESAVLSIRMSSMSYSSGKIEIVDANFLPKDIAAAEAGELGEHPELSKKVLPIMLEEWMHQLQRLEGKPVSKLTEAYIEDTGIGWGGLHEMDIQAAFREWDFPVDDLGTAHAYSERRDFEAWYQAKRRDGALP